MAGNRQTGSHILKAVTQTSQKAEIRWEHIQLWRITKPMRSIKPFLLRRRFLSSVIVALLVTVVQTGHAQTLWTGPNINFTEAGNSDVILAGKVALSRGSSQWLYNTAAGETSAGTLSPTDTLWALGPTNNYLTLTYQTMDSLRNGDLGSVIVGQQMVLQLVNEQIYIPIQFSQWGEHGAGGFSYTRATVSSAPPPPPTPTVTLTNPVAGASFSAPASVSLGASASVSSGTVTNVSFFGNGALLGSAGTSPFTATSSPLAAGSYALTAVATAAGVSATSAVVNITVVAPPPTPTVSITNPAPGATFSAPASVSLGASASVSSGTVTNVSFFGNGTLLGSAKASPFTVTSSPLAAGPYVLTAIATAAGVSATSAVVNITVVASTPTPSVTITNPVAGAIFAAPANVKLGASASVSSGSVTNVAFFGNGTLLGSVQAAPFNVTSSALAAGSYSLTAIATAAGISATSTPVSISVVAPVTVTNSAPQVSNGIFAFSYSANIGLTYVVQDSSDLVNWLSLSTNIAATTTLQATDTFSSGSPRFYRVFRRPNP
jgi:hypothetical protein